MSSNLKSPGGMSPDFNLSITISVSPSGFMEFWKRTTIFFWFENDLFGALHFYNSKIKDDTINNIWIKWENEIKDAACFHFIYFKIKFTLIKVTLDIDQN